MEKFNEHLFSGKLRNRRKTSSLWELLRPPWLNFMLVVVSVDFLFGDFGTQFINDCSGASISALSVSSLILSMELSSQKLRRAKSIFLDFLTKASSFPTITTLNNWIISSIILSHCARFIELPCIVWYCIVISIWNMKPSTFFNLGQNFFSEFPFIGPICV